MIWMSYIDNYYTLNVILIGQLLKGLFGKTTKVSYGSYGLSVKSMYVLYSSISSQNDYTFLQTQKYIYYNSMI